MASEATIRIDRDALKSVQESIQLGKTITQQKLAACQSRLARFEKEKQMDTDTFLRLFEDGQLGDDADLIEWEHFARVSAILNKKLSDLETVRYES
jgi:urease accessory protein UreE